MISFGFLLRVGNFFKKTRWFHLVFFDALETFLRKLDDFIWFSLTRWKLFEENSMISFAFLWRVWNFSKKTRWFHLVFFDASETFRRKLDDFIWFSLTRLKLLKENSMISFGFLWCVGNFSKKTRWFHLVFFDALETFLRKLNDFVWFSLMRWKLFEEKSMISFGFLLRVGNFSKKTRWFHSVFFDALESFLRKLDDFIWFSLMRWKLF